MFCGGNEEGVVMKYMEQSEAAEYISKYKNSSFTTVLDIRRVQVMPDGHEWVSYKDVVFLNNETSKRCSKCYQVIYLSRYFIMDELHWAKGYREGPESCSLVQMRMALL